MINWPHPDELENVSDHQREQYSVISNSGSRIAILNGGPGVGKTFSVAAIVKAAMWSGVWSIGLAAPTGKAAIRMTELMREHGLNLEARTIHRLLGVTRSGHDGGGWGFFHSAANPLPQKLICIDEASMLSTGLGASLFSAIRPDALVLLIGDTGQLLPVSHGAPLRDFLKAGVPSATLTEIRRTSGDMAFACKSMAETGAFTPSRGKNLEAGQNWWHIESRSPAMTTKIIQSLMGNLPAQFSKDDAQVLCCLNTKGPLSRIALNDLLAPVCNPVRKEKPAKHWFANNDKVMCLENGYYKSLLPSAEEDPREFVANGETGFVVDCTPSRCAVEFDGPHRKIEFIGEGMKALTLAYAITIWKSQGSQWPVVIYPIDDHSSARHVGCRELVYTGVSRQQVLTITIGMESVGRKICEKISIENRKTFLAEDLVA